MDVCSYVVSRATCDVLAMNDALRCTIPLLCKRGHRQEKKTAKANSIARAERALMAGSTPKHYEEDLGLHKWTT